MHRAVLRQLANKRQGTASTLTRSEVRGGGRKPYKQKGTGRARQGSIINIKPNNVVGKKGGEKSGQHSKLLSGLVKNPATFLLI